MSTIISRPARLSICIGFCLLLSSFSAVGQPFWNTTTFPAILVNALASDTNGLIFAGTRDSGIYRSTNNGTSWLNVKSISPGGAIHCLTVDRTNNNVFAGTDTLMFKSTDQGLHWTIDTIGLGSQFIHAVTAKAGTVFACADSGLFRSTDAGAHWTNLDPFNLQNVWSILVSANGELFAGTIYDGVFRSTNNGVNWNRSNTGLAEDSVYIPAIAQRGNIVFAATINGVYSSSDSGAHWVRSDSLGNGANCLAVSTVGNVFAGSEGDGVSISTNGGAIWQPANEGLLDSTVESVMVTQNGYLWAGTYSGIFRSALTTGVRKFTSELPVAFSLEQNYPNPFNPLTVISYQLSVSGYVTLKVYDVLGREVATLVNERQFAGYNSVRFDASRLPTGVYLYRLTVGELSQTKKMVLIK